METHTLVLIIELLAPPTPFARAAQIRVLYPALLEEPPRGFPVVLLWLALESRRLLLKRGIYLVRERLECSNVPPGARAHRAREKNAEGGEAEAALTLLGGLTPAEDADTTMRVFGKVAGGWGNVRFSSQEDRREVRGIFDGGRCGALTRRHALQGVVHWAMR
jgi:hypothetical protein